MRLDVSASWINIDTFSGGHAAQKTLIFSWNSSGDFDSFNKQGVLNLCSMLGFFPYACLYGHMHTPSMDEINGIKMVRSGSIPGSGDNYTIEKRLSGKPSQTVLVCDNSGIKCIYNVELK